LLFVFAIFPDHSDRLGLANFPFGNDQIRVLKPQQLPGVPEPGIT
jgi:hypothetical protein